MKCKMFSYEQKAIGVAMAKLWWARATANALFEVMPLRSAVPALEAESEQMAHVVHPDRAAGMQAG